MDEPTVEPAEPTPTAATSPRKLRSSEIDALPVGPWIRHRFGIGHRLALVVLPVSVVVFNSPPSTLMLVLLPAVMWSFLYWGDIVIAVGYRLGLTSHRSLYPANVRPGATWGEIGEILTAEAKAEEAGETIAFDRRRDGAIMARSVLYVVGIPSGLAVVVGIIVASGGAYQGAAFLVIAGMVGLLIAVAPAIGEWRWRQATAEPSRDIAGLRDIARPDGRVAEPAVPEPGLAKPPPRPVPWVTIAFVATVAVSFLVVGYDTVTRPQPAVGPSPVGDPGLRSQASMYGSGHRDSEPFSLDSGDYDVTFSAADAGYGCRFIAELADFTGGLQRLVDVDVPVGRPMADTIAAHGVAHGVYSIHVLSNCTWSVSMQRK